MKNHLVVIGWMGAKKAYLNVSREEALRRYVETEGEIDGEHIAEFDFDDQFCVYDAWE